MTVNDYATLAEVQAALPDIQTLTSVQNAFLTSLITRMSRAVDRKTGREPGSYNLNGSTDTRYFDGPEYNSAYSAVQGGDPWQHMDNRASGGMLSYRSLWIDEMADVPTALYVTPDGNTNNYQQWPATDSNNQPTFWMWPTNSKSFGQPYTRIDLNVLYGQHQVWYTFPRAVKIVGPFGYANTTPDDVKDCVITQVARSFNRAQQHYQDLAVITDQTMLVYSRIDHDLAEMILYLRRQAV